MTPEEFQRYKEAEKAHLRKLKELKKAVHTLERQKSMRSAVEKIAEGQDLLEKQKDLVDELALDTARHEARLDMALDSEVDAETAEKAELMEEELQRERAQALVKQLKREMGDVDDGASIDSGQPQRRSADLPGRGVSERLGKPESKGDGPVHPSNPTRGRDDRPEKTIGRM